MDAQLIDNYTEKILVLVYLSICGVIYTYCNEVESKLHARLRPPRRFAGANGGDEKVRTLHRKPVGNPSKPTLASRYYLLSQLLRA